jgi:hypothetical protein
MNRTEGIASLESTNDGTMLKVNAFSELTCTGRAASGSKSVAGVSTHQPLTAKIGVN